MEEFTTITIKKSTKKRLERIGSFGESWDELLNRSMDLIEKFAPEFVKAPEVAEDATQSG